MLMAKVMDTLKLFFERTGETKEKTFCAQSIEPFGVKIYIVSLCLSLELPYGPIRNRKEIEPSVEPFHFC
jgi:hypothetical protein